MNLKRTIEVDRICTGREREKIRTGLYSAAVETPTRTGRLSVRQLDRISAITGCPWDAVSGEAQREGL